MLAFLVGVPIAANVLLALCWTLTVHLSESAKREAAFTSDPLAAPYVWEMSPG